MIVVNFKNYKTGKQVLELAKKLNKKRIIIVLPVPFTPPAPSQHLTSARMRQCFQFGSSSTSTSTTISTDIKSFPTPFSLAGFVDRITDEPNKTQENYKIHDCPPYLIEDVVFQMPT